MHSLWVLRNFLLICVGSLSLLTIYMFSTNVRSQMFVKLFVHPMQNESEIIIIDPRFWNNQLSLFDRMRVMVNQWDYNSSSLNQTLDIIFFENDPKKDYFVIHDDVERIILKFKTVNIDQYVKVPENTTRFEEYWRRSELRKSLHLNMQRNRTEPPVIPSSFVNVMAALRDYLIGEGIFPLIAGGTLLGWYREGTFISHTTDADMMVNASQISDHNFLKRFADQKNTLFKLNEVLGLPHDSFEIKASTKDGPNIDVFGVYATHNGTWVGGTNRVKKFRYDYIKLDKICAADLHDRLFFVPCEVEKWVECEYGPDWMKDKSSDTYVWYASQFNVREAGNWTRAELFQMSKKWNIDVIRKL